MIDYKILRVVQGGGALRCIVTLFRGENVERPATRSEVERWYVDRIDPNRGVSAVRRGGVRSLTSFGARPSLEPLVRPDPKPPLSPAPPMDPVLPMLDTVVAFERREVLGVRELVVACECGDQPCAHLAAAIEGELAALFPGEEVACE